MLTATQAREILDRAREGDPTITRPMITAALETTGDLDGDGRPYVIRRSPGSWERPGVALLGRATWLSNLH